MGVSIAFGTNNIVSTIVGENGIRNLNPKAYDTVQNVATGTALVGGILLAPYATTNKANTAKTKEKEVVPEGKGNVAGVDSAPKGEEMPPAKPPTGNTYQDVNVNPDKNSQNTPNQTAGEGTGQGEQSAKTPMSGEDWNNYFNETYGSDNVTWESASISDIIDMPSKITHFSPQQIANLARANGWTVESLGKGSLAGIPYEQGGGFSMRAPNGGSEYIQYHPGGGHHGSLPYYKVSSGPNGTVRYNLDGGVIK